MRVTIDSGNGTRIQTTGGTSLQKYYWAGPVSTPGIEYDIHFYIVNNSTTTSVKAHNGAGTSAIIPPGNSQSVYLPMFGNGVLELQLVFESLNISDSLDFTVRDMFIGQLNGSSIENTWKNLILYPEDFTQTWWTKNKAGTGVTPVVTANAGTAPDNSVTAERLQLDMGTGGTINDISWLASAALNLPVGTRFVASLWIKSNTGLAQTVGLRSPAGAITLCNLTTSWQRFSVADTVPSNAVYDMQIITRGTYGTTQVIDALIWGAQIEIVPSGLSAPSTYAQGPTNNWSYWDSVVTTLLKQSAPFDYTSYVSDGSISVNDSINSPVTTQMILENIRASFVVPTRSSYMRMFTDKYPTLTNIAGQVYNYQYGAWLWLNSQVSPTTVPDPLGLGEYATLCSADSTSNQHGVQMAFQAVQNKMYTWSLYLKDAGQRYCCFTISSYGTVFFDMQTGQIGAIGYGTQPVGQRAVTNIGNGWWRLQLSFFPSTTAAQTWSLVGATSNISGSTVFSGTGQPLFYFWGLGFENNWPAASPFQLFRKPPVPLPIVSPDDFTSVTWLKDGTVGASAPTIQYGLENDVYGNPATTVSFPSVTGTQLSRVRQELYSAGNFSFLTAGFKAGENLMFLVDVKFAAGVSGDTGTTQLRLEGTGGVNATKAMPVTSQWQTFSCFGTFASASPTSQRIYVNRGNGSSGTNPAVQIVFANVRVYYAPGSSTNAFPYTYSLNKVLATGFITNDPARQYRGLSQNAGVNVGFQHYGYKINVTSDEWLLNSKSVPFIPAYINQTQGQILARLANALCPNFFDTSGIQDGDLIPYFQYDPNKNWSQIAKEFGDASRYRYQVIDRKIYYTPFGDAPLGVNYDESGFSSSFDPNALNSDVVTVPPVNDAIVIGDAEPQTYCEDSFVGDGFTGNFPLHHKVFSGVSTKLLDQPWSDASIPTDSYTVMDPFNMFQMAGALNALGTGSILGQSYILSNNGLELGGQETIQHGEFTFTDVNEGVIGGLYADASMPNSVTGVIAGFYVNSPAPPSTLAPSISGATGLEIHPIFAGRIYGGNLVTYSEDVTKWVIQKGGAVTTIPIVTADYAPGPPGTGIATADRIIFSLQGNTASADLSRVIQTGTTNTGGVVTTVAAGELYTISLWIKTTDGSTKTMRLEAASGVATVLITVTGQWQRFSSTWTSSGSGVNPGIYFGLRGNTGIITSDSADVLVSGAQMERGSFMSSYDPTGATLNNQYVVKTKQNCHYVLNTYLSGSRWDRYSRIYRTLNGSQRFGGYGTNSNINFNFAISEIPLANPLVPTVTNWSVTGNQINVPSFGVYGPLNMKRAALSVSSTLIMEPPQVFLQVASFFGPTGGQLPLKSYQLGSYQPYSVGYGLQNQYATVSNSNGDTDQIQFYVNPYPVAGKTGLPAVGSRIKIRSWMTGSAIGRVRDTSAIASEAVVSGDDGVRLAIMSGLSPLPRTSEEAELAAAAAITDRKNTQFQGSYQIADYFWNSNYDLPRSGRFFYCNAPNRGIVAQNLMAQSVQVQVVELKSEQLNIQISFGPDLRLDNMLPRFLPQITSLLTPKDTASRPQPITLQQLGTSWLQDLRDATITDWNGRTFTVDYRAPAISGYNLISGSEEFGNPVIWIPNVGTPITQAPIVVPNYTVGPDGVTKTAAKVTLPAINGTGWSRLYNLPSPSRVGSVWGRTFTYTIWIRSDNPFRMRIQINNASLTTNRGNTIFTPTTQWAPYSVTIILPSTSDGFPDLAVIVGSDVNTTIAGGDIYIANAQLEENSKFTTYQSSPYLVYEMRRSDANWGSGASGQNLIYSTNTATPVTLNRLGYDQTVFVRMVAMSGSLKSRFATKLRLQAQMVPTAPSYVIDWTNPFRPVVQLDFGNNPDIRNVSVIEVRASDNVTPVYQKIYGGTSDLGYIFDNSLVQSRTLSFWAYFANLMWDYSPGTSISTTLNPPTVLNARIDDAYLALVINMQANQAPITQVEYQIFADASLVNMSSSGMVGTNILPGDVGNITIGLSNRDIVQQRWVRVRGYDGLGSGNWSSTVAHTYTAMTVNGFDNVNNIDSVPAQTNATTDPPVSTLPSLDPGEQSDIQHHGRINRVINLD